MIADNITFDVVEFLWGRMEYTKLGQEEKRRNHKQSPCQFTTLVVELSF